MYYNNGQRKERNNRTKQTGAYRETFTYLYV